jgi:hypothetical protein
MLKQTMATTSARKRRHASPKPVVEKRNEKTTVSYFQLSNHEMQHLAGLSLFEKSLLSSLVHTLRLGVHLDQETKGTAAELAETGLAASTCKKYIDSALASDFASDKYFPLRLTGSSMKTVVGAFPLQNASASNPSAKNVFQICIWRTFAFGDKAHITQLTLREQGSPDLTSIAAVICTWGGAVNIALPAYGNFQVVKRKVPDMLSLLWEFSQIFAAEITTRVSPYTFAELHETLCKKAVPSIPRGGIVTWLLISDFSEYGICLPPTEEDLAQHIIPSKRSGGSPSGPSAALKHVAEQCKGHVPKDADALARVIRNVLKVFNNPPEQLLTVRKLVCDCEEIQGRKLGVVDVEHALCKISRQVSMAAMRRGHKSKKQKVRES